MSTPTLKKLEQQLAILDQEAAVAKRKLASCKRWLAVLNPIVAVLDVIQIPLNLISAVAWLQTLYKWVLLNHAFLSGSITQDSLLFSCLVWLIQALTLVLPLLFYRKARSIREQMYRDFPESAPQEREGESSKPRNAQYLLWLLMPRAQREAVIGDIAEQFAQVEQSQGLRRARAWYWCEVARSLWPIAMDCARRLVKWGVFGAAAEWLRRFI